MSQRLPSSFETGDPIGTRPWRIVGGLIAGLIVAVALASGVAFVQNNRVRDVTQRALLYDLEIEDEGDDLRVAVLDMRHHHRDLVFYGPTEVTLANFDESYAKVLDEIDELEEVGIVDPAVPQPAYIRALAERYYAEFRPAVALYDADRTGFRQASDAGLLRIDELDDAADVIDGLGERTTEESLTRVDDAATTERFTLIAVLGGVCLIGVILILSAGRILSRLHVSYNREQAAARELARSLRMKTDFISDASHELRTPLTVIRGNAEIGLGSTDERVRTEVLTEIEAEAARMAKLVEDLLFLARSDAGLPPLEREIVPARWLISRVTKPAAVLATQRASCLTSDIGAEGYLDIDPGRVEQAVLILVDNAAKHAPAGTCVALTSGQRDGHLAIEVADAGPGIAEEELPLIFDRFYQVGNRRSRKKGGSGLGLAIAKTIVEAHGGRIEVESRTGAGARLTILLPFISTPESPDAAEQRSVLAYAGAEAIDPKRTDGTRSLVR